MQIRGAERVGQGSESYGSSVVGLYCGIGGVAVSHPVGASRSCGRPSHWMAAAGSSPSTVTAWVQIIWCLLL